MGRHSVRLQQLGQRIIMAELWHNTDWCFSGMVNALSGLVLTEKNERPEPDGWSKTGIRIAVLFGIFGELIREDIASAEKTVDISVVSGDFSGPMAAWYARTMGLPIGNIVCCCNENSCLWDFICHGQLRSDCIARQTLVPEGDTVIPEGLERLIAAYGGPEEVHRYVDTLRRGGNYYVEDGFLRRLRQGLYATVSSEKRLLTTIPSAMSTHGYLLSAASALAYAGLLDYRARTGAMRTALVLTEKSPARDAEAVSQALGISREALAQYLK